MKEGMGGYLVGLAPPSDSSAASKASDDWSVAWDFASTLLFAAVDHAHLMVRALMWQEHIRSAGAAECAKCRAVCKRSGEQNRVAGILTCCRREHLLHPQLGCSISLRVRFVTCTSINGPP